MSVYKKNTILGLEAAKETVRFRKEVTNNKTVRNLLFISHLKAISKEAKKYLVTDDATNGIEKFALISNSSFTTLFGNTFLKIVPPKIPTRLFSDKESAVKWLKAD